MTHSLLTQDYSRNQALIRSNQLVQHIKLYSLFKRDCNGRWVRISTMAYNEKLAYRVFGESLSKDIMGFSIRPIKIESFEAR